MTPQNWNLSEEDRPDPPDLDDARCEVAGCDYPATVACWSTELGVFLQYCDDCAAEKTEEFPDLEVIGDA